jgi:hypothetical protein
VVNGQAEAEDLAVSLLEVHALALAPGATTDSMIVEVSYLPALSGAVALIEALMRTGMIDHWGSKFVISACFAIAVSDAAADPVLYKTKNSEIQFIAGKPRRIIIHTVSSSQEDIRILGRSVVDRECRTIGLANYDVVTPPVNGAACYREETQIVSVQPFGDSNGRCLGSPAPHSRRLLQASRRLSRAGCVSIRAGGCEAPADIDSGCRCNLDTTAELFAAARREPRNRYGFRWPSESRTNAPLP